MLSIDWLLVWPSPCHLSESIMSSSYQCGSGNKLPFQMKAMVSRKKAKGKARKEAKAKAEEEYAAFRPFSLTQFKKSSCTHGWSHDEHPDNHNCCSLLRMWLAFHRTKRKALTFVKQLMTLPYIWEVYPDIWKDPAKLEWVASAFVSIGVEAIILVLFCHLFELQMEMSKSFCGKRLHFVDAQHPSLMHVFLFQLGWHSSSWQTEAEDRMIHWFTIWEAEWVSIWCITTCHMLDYFTALLLIQIRLHFQLFNCALDHGPTSRWRERERSTEDQDALRFLRSGSARMPGLMLVSVVVSVPNCSL